MKLNTTNILLLVVGVLVLAGGAYFMYNKYSMPASTADMTPEQLQAETQRIVAKVGKLMVVPEGDVPVLVKIDNVDQLKQQQAFFQEAQNGDVVLIFPKSAKAVIFSEARNVIVNSGPVQSAPAPTTPAANTAPTTTSTSTKEAAKKK